MIFLLLARIPEAIPKIANPPITNGISVEKLMYNPPRAPVISPTHGPANIPLIRMGTWVRWMFEFKVPIITGITKGGVDKMFERATIIAMKAMVLALLSMTFKQTALY